MKSVRVGVAYEGGLDTAYVIGLIHKLLQDREYTVSDIDPVKAGTVITKFVPVYSKKFENDKRDILIFLTDSDGGKNTKKQIRDKIAETNPLLLEISVVGIPEPHLERWIIGDEDAVKKVFEMDGASPLPHPKLKPKERLIALYEQSNFSGTLDDAKLEILGYSKIETIGLHCPDFKSFKEELDAVLNVIESK